MRRNLAVNNGGTNGRGSDGKAVTAVAKRCPVVFGVTLLATCCLPAAIATAQSS